MQQRRLLSSSGNTLRHKPVGNKALQVAINIIDLMRDKLRAKPLGTMEFSKGGVVIGERGREILSHAESMSLINEREDYPVIKHSDRICKE